MNSLMMLAVLAIGQTTPIYIPRTEYRESTTLVPRVEYDEVKTQTPVTVYDRYRYELVPDGTVEFPVESRYSVRVPRFIRPFRTPVVVEKFNYRVRGRTYSPWRPYR